MRILGVFALILALLNQGIAPAAWANSNDNSDGKDKSDSADAPDVVIPASEYKQYLELKREKEEAEKRRADEELARIEKAFMQQLEARHKKELEEVQHRGEVDYLVADQPDPLEIQNLMGTKAALKFRRAQNKKYPGLKKAVQALLQEMGDLPAEELNEIETRIHLLSTHVRSLGTSPRFSSQYIDKTGTAENTLGELGKKLALLLGEGLVARETLNLQKNKTNQPVYREDAALVDRLNQLEATPARRPEVIAAETLRVYLEMQLIAGKTWGNVHDMYNYSGAASAIAGFLLMLKIILIDTLLVKNATVTGISMATAAILFSGFMWDIMKRDSASENTDPLTHTPKLPQASEIWKPLFPYMATYQAKKNAEQLLERLPANIRFAFSQQYQFHDWEFYKRYMSELGTRTFSIGGDRTPVGVIKLIETIAERPITAVFDDMQNQGQKVREECKAKAERLLAETTKLRIEAAAVMPKPLSPASISTTIGAAAPSADYAPTSRDTDALNEAEATAEAAASDQSTVKKEFKEGY